MTEKANYIRIGNDDYHDEDDEDEAKDDDKFHMTRLPFKNVIIHQGIHNFSIRMTKKLTNLH